MPTGLSTTTMGAPTTGWAAASRMGSTSEPLRTYATSLRGATAIASGRPPTSTVATWRVARSMMETVVDSELETITLAPSVLTARLQGPGPTAMARCATSVARLIGVTVLELKFET